MHQFLIHISVLVYSCSVSHPSSITMPWNFLWYMCIMMVNLFLERVYNLPLVTDLLNKTVIGCGSWSSIALLYLWNTLMKPLVEKQGMWTEQYPSALKIHIGQRKKIHSKIWDPAGIQTETFRMLAGCSCKWLTGSVINGEREGQLESSESSISAAICILVSAAPLLWVHASV